MNVYIVKRGMTLADIARRYGMTLDTILRLNPGITNPDLLYIGQSITLPPNALPLPILYKVKPGESLYSIANKFDVDLEMVLRANPELPNPDLIIPGVQIILPAAEPSPGVTLYAVQPGDSLFKISQAIGINFNTLLQINPQLPNANTLYIGQLIYVPLPATPQPVPFNYQGTNDDLALAQIDSASKNYLNGYSFNDMVPLANGWVILGDIAANTVYIVNAVTGQVWKAYPLQSSPERIDFDFANGNILTIQAATNQIAKININTDVITYIKTTGTNTTVSTGENNIAFSYSSKWPNGIISIIDTAANQEIGTAAITDSYIGYMAYAPENHNLFLGVQGISPSNLYRYSFDPAAHTLKFKQTTRDLGSNGEDLAVSNDGKHVAFPVGSGNGNGYTIFDIDSSDLNHFLGQWQVGAYPTSAFFSPDSSYIVTTNRSDVKIYTVGTHQLISTINVNNSSGNISRVYFSRGGKIIYAGIDSSSGITKLYFYKSGLY